MHKTIFLAAIAAAAPASAHIVLAPAEAAAGGYYAGMLRVGHGCDAAATTAIRIAIPEGVLVARPQPKPGWTVAIERERLASPATLEGKRVDDRVSAITWRGTLPPDQFDEFGLMLKLPAGTTGTMYMPVTQSCAERQVRWEQIPARGAAWTSVPHPAPMLEVKAPSGAHAH